MNIVHTLKMLTRWGGIRRDVVFLCISGGSLAISFCGLQPFSFDAAWIAIVLCGLPIILEAVIGLVTAFDIKAGVLVSLALIASVATGENFAAGEVAFIMQIGALLENLTVAKARAGIEKLVRLTPQTARVVQGQDEGIIPVDQVTVGATVRVLPGETVPVDGIIRMGSTSINQAVMTGESLPVDKGVGDTVISGTVNQFGAFVMEATHVGKDSSMQRMVRLVRSADAGKAKIVRLADHWATWVVVIALASAALAWLVTGEFIRAVTILVVFCPCALVLATPTAITAAIGNATRHGFLVREGDALERLSQVSRCAFDKTGTLTLGTPRVVAVKSLMDNLADGELHRLAAGAELLSEHPLGMAIARSFRGHGAVTPEEVAEFHMFPGKGVTARVQGRAVVAGNLKLLRERGIADVAASTDIAAPYVERGCAIIYCAVDGKLAGCIALADTLRKDAPNVVESLRRLNVTAVLLTGDHEHAARQIAKQAGIDAVHANCLPEDKLHYIRESRKNGIEMCMIGDGINDAPALKTAHVGIAMGGIGSDIAVDTADIALVHDEIRELPHLVALARRTMLTIKYNLAFSMGLNFLAIILATTGFLNPVTGALVHNAGSVFVIANSALLLHWRDRG